MIKDLTAIKPGQISTLNISPVKALLSEAIRVRDLRDPKKTEKILESFMALIEQIEGHGRYQTTHLGRKLALLQPVPDNEAELPF